MKLILLGSGGWVPTPRRHTCSCLLATDTQLILIDSGSGLSRLAEYRELYDRCDTLNVIYTHYHLDHTAGLSYLPNWPQKKRLRIWGPGTAFYPHSCRDILSTLIAPPYFPRPLENFAEQVEIQDYTADGFAIDDLPVRVLPQQHSQPSCGLTFGAFLHYATDTLPLEATFQRAQETRLLLHECWSAPRLPSPGHSSAEELSELASRIPVPRMVLIHINPTWTEADEAEALQAFGGAPHVSIAQDGMEIELAG